MQYDAIIPLLFLIATAGGLYKLYTLNKKEEYLSGKDGNIMFIQVTSCIIWVVIFLFLCHLSGCFNISQNLPDSQTSSYTETIED